MSDRLSMEPDFRATLKFYPTEAGGYRGPLDHWPIRIVLLFDDEPELHYGVLVLSAGQTVIMPGDIVQAEIAGYAREVIQPKLSLGREFLFGEFGRMRGEGVVTWMAEVSPQ